MEAHIEGTMDEAVSRHRLLVPTLIVATLVIAIGAAAFMMRGGGTGSEDGKGAAMAAAGAAGGKNGDGEEKEKAPVPVNIEAVAVDSISSYLTATANLVAEQQVDLVAESEGRVTQLNVEEGDTVSRGAVLATLNRDDAQIVVNKAKVRAANARAVFERARDMFEQGLMSRSDFDVRDLEKRVADEELAEAQYRLAKTVIRSPFSGRVTARQIVAGQHVRPGDKLFTVTDFDPLVARIYLPERDVVGLSEGQPVRLTMRAAEGVVFQGRIRQISPVVDSSTGTVKLTIESSNTPAAVRPGAFVAVDITKETRPRALVIPREAVIRELSEAHVFVVEGDVARKRIVQLGIEESTRVEAREGLAAGDRVIVAGQGGLRDGSPVKVLDVVARAEPVRIPVR